VIDLGCPIDLHYDASNPALAGQGWMLDDNRPTLNVTIPAGAREPLTRILIGHARLLHGARHEELPRCC